MTRAHRGSRGVAPRAKADLQLLRFQIRVRRFTGYVRVSVIVGAARYARAAAARTARASEAESLGLAGVTRLQSAASQSACASQIVCVVID
jgi:hypothetical protein